MFKRLKMEDLIQISKSSPSIFQHLAISMGLSIQETKIAIEESRVLYDPETRRGILTLIDLIRNTDLEVNYDRDIDAGYTIEEATKALQRFKEAR